MNVRSRRERDLSLSVIAVIVRALLVMSDACEGAFRRVLSGRPRRSDRLSSVAVWGLAKVPEEMLDNLKLGA